MRLNEDIFEDAVPAVENEIVLSDTQIEPEPPTRGPENGFSSLIIDAINSTWGNIVMYNNMIATAEAEGFNELLEPLTSIVNDETNHVGQLEKLLETVSPNAELIEVGKDEVELDIEVEDED